MKHTVEFYDHISAMAEPPYNKGDFNWRVECEECKETLAEGDGYNVPSDVDVLVKKLETKHIEEYTKRYPEYYHESSK